MNSKTINYLKVLQQQFNKGSISKKKYKKELKFVREFTINR